MQKTVEELQQLQNNALFSLRAVDKLTADKKKLVGDLEAELLQSEDYETAEKDLSLARERYTLAKKKTLEMNGIAKAIQEELAETARDLKVVTKELEVALRELDKADGTLIVDGRLVVKIYKVK